MALRLRRGTDAERQLITPVQGELIYTTDTKLLYVGDGSTAGGTLVTGAGGGSTTLDALTDTDLTGAVNNDVLTFNAGTNKWEAVAIPGVGILSLTDLSDVFLPVDPDVGDILRWDGLNFTASPPSEIFQEQQNYKINIVGDDSTILVNTDTNTFTGNFVGDGSQLTNVPGASISSLNDLSDVFLPNSPEVGSILRWDGLNFTASPPSEIFQEQQNYKINIVGDDSTILVNTDTNTFTGNFVGDVFGNVFGNVFGIVTGDIQGSVFADDSTLLVDSVNGLLAGTVVGEIVTKQNIVVNLNKSDDNGNNNGIKFNKFRGTIENPLEPNNFDRTTIIWNSYDPLSTTYQTDALISGYHQTGGGGYIALTASDDSYTVFNTAIELDGKLGTILLLGTTSVTGSLSVSNGITGDLTGSVFSDSSTMLIDGTNGSLLAANIDVIGSVAGTPSVGAGDLANVNEWLQVTVNGNTRYIPLYA